MLKKQNRLRTVNKSNKDTVFSTKFLSARISQEKKDALRFAFIVSKKISTSAVVRNKTKRVLRKAIEEDLEKIKINKDITIVAKRRLDWSQKEEIRKDLENVFIKAKVL